MVIYDQITNPEVDALWFIVIRSSCLEIDITWGSKSFLMH